MVANRKYNMGKKGLTPKQNKRTKQKFGKMLGAKGITSLKSKKK